MASFKIEDPTFAEFVYHNIISANSEQRTRVPFGFEKFLYPPSATKSFAERASLESRLVMLSRLGIEWQIWLAPTHKHDKKDILAALDDFKNEDRSESINRMIAGKHFVFGGRDVMTALALMAQNCHSETYRINSEYTRMTQAIVDGEKKFSDIEKVKAAFEDFKVLLKFAMKILAMQDFFDGAVSFKAEEMMILNFLFLRKNTFIRIKELQDAFGQYKAATIVTACGNLWRANFIEKFPSQSRYTISSTGMQVVANFINRSVYDTLNK